MIEKSEQHRRITRFAIILSVVWTLLVVASFTWFNIQQNRSIEAVSLAQARTVLESDFLYRIWASRIGGVYVDTGKQIQPNPILERVPERDVTTPSGRRLTLLNSAYMARLVNDFAKNEKFNVTGVNFTLRAHLTSLKPIRPENGPDPWEDKVLHLFERGVKEFNEISDINGAPHMRLMRSLILIEACLKCHPDYRVGDIRGGVSYSVPLADLLASRRSSIVSAAGTHGAIWLFGLGTIGFGCRRLIASAHALTESEERYRTIVETSNEGICTLGPDATVTFVNSRMAEMLGRAGNEIIGRPLVEFMFEEDVPDQECKLENRRRGLSESYERRFRRETDEAVWTLVSASPLLDDCHSYQGSLGMVSDITERKLAEEELHRLKEELEERVDERTAELEQKNTELARLNKVFVGRELRMIELKERIRELEKGTAEKVEVL